MYSIDDYIYNIDYQSRYPEDRYSKLGFITNYKHWYWYR